MKVYSVSQINNYIKRLFENDVFLQDIYIEAEISNFKAHSSGHLYMTLKDSGAAVNAVMFRSYAEKLKFMPEDGMKVLINGYISLYEKTGQYQFYVLSMEPAGKGALYIAYEQLKERLEHSGVFDQKYKKDIPSYPKCVAVITSPTGAAVRDIIQVSGRRNPNVKIVVVPVLVQGDDAAPSIANAIESVNKWGQADTIIVGRGGGSIEDLWAFNEEMVARAIFESKIPIISAVGHETDFTIADFIADMRAPTPSAAAEIAIPENEGMSLAVINNYKRLNYLMDIILSSRKNNLQTLSTKHCFTGFADNIYDHEIYVSQLQNRLISKIQNKIEFANQTLKHKIDNLENISPLKILQKGYSLTYNDKQKLIRSTESVNIGDKINVVLNDGNITATVEEVRNNNGYEENI